MCTRYNKARAVMGASIINLTYLIISNNQKLFYTYTILYIE